MRIYYLQAEYQIGKHRIVKVLWDDEVFKFDEGTLSPFLTLDIAELDPVNKALAQDLKRRESKTDTMGEGKYYIDSTGQLMERTDWVEYISEPF